MDWKTMTDTDEKPLDSLISDGGFVSIFRTIGCIGDSLASGEFEGYENGETRVCIDMFDYSWGQFMGRTLGSRVYNFSKGGMSAKEYCDSFAKANNLWDPAKRCQAYIIALGVNDISALGTNLGALSDIDTDDCEKNKDSFAGNYAKIIQKMKLIQPEAKFFLVTVPKSNHDEKRREAEEIHQKLLYGMANLFSNTYVLDFREYGPFHDDAFKQNFYMSGHLNPMGYILTSKMMISYIDYIIRHNMEDFKRVGFIGTEFEHLEEQKRADSTDDTLVFASYDDIIQ